MGAQFLLLKSKLCAINLALLDGELNRYLANESGVRLDRTNELETWRSSHQPFHWFIEFHEIMERGGFDVIVGNSPLCCL